MFIFIKRIISSIKFDIGNYCLQKIVDFLKHIKIELPYQSFRLAQGWLRVWPVVVKVLGSCTEIFRTSSSALKLLRILCNFLNSDSIESCVYFDLEHRNVSRKIQCSKTIFDQSIYYICSLYNIYERRSYLIALPTHLWWTRDCPL